MTPLALDDARRLIQIYCKIPPLRLGGFQGILELADFVCSVNSARGLSSRCRIGSMNPPSYPSAWLPPRRARFHFTGEVI
jgi:hypothetical protein